MRTLLLRPIRKSALLSAVALSAAFSPLAAQSARYQDCLDDIISWCDDTLSSASWWEKPAIGLVCTGMLGGCGFVNPL